MALSEQEKAALRELHAEHPEWKHQRLLEAAGLPQTAYFGVRNLFRSELPSEQRKRAGRKPGPKRGEGAHRGRSAASAPAAASAATDLLDDGDTTDDDATPTRRAGRAKSPLAVLKPQVIRGIATWLLRATSRDGQRPDHGMTIHEAVGVAAPAVRIADRTLAKYVKFSGPVNENLADAGAALVIVLAWGLRIWIQNAQRRAGPAPIAQATPPDVGMQAGYHAPIRLYTTPAYTTPAADSSDLFAGSEPVTASSMPQAARPAPTRNLNGSGPAGAVAVNDEFWAQVSPPDLGGEVG